MDFDALTAGIEPGGLRNKGEIRVLICYLLAGLQEGLSKEDIISVLQENGLANYFETADAFSSLLESGSIAPAEETPSRYRVTEEGRLIARQLDVTVPVAVREKALNAAVSLLARIKRETENQVQIKRCERGYQVICHISGGNMDLMSFTLYVPDLMQAKMVRANFHEDPEKVYRCMLALVTQNTDLVADALNEINRENGL